MKDPYITGIKAKKTDRSIPKVNAVKTTMRTLLFFFSIIIFVGCSRDNTSWKVGDAWTVRVAIYPNPAIVATSSPDTNRENEKVEPWDIYDMKIEVVGIEKIDSLEFWKVNFTPADTALAGVKGQAYQILVDRTTGEATKIVKLAGMDIRNPRIEAFDGHKFLLDSPFGFPMEIIPRLRIKIMRY